MRRTEVDAFVAGLLRVHVRASELDPRPFSVRYDEAELTVRIVEPLAALLRQTLETVRAFEDACVELGSQRGCDDGTSLVPPFVEASLWLRVADLCFGVRHELSHASARLSRELPAEERVAACDSSRRRLRRATQVIAQAMLDAGADLPVAPWWSDADTESAVAVRAAYARFRRSLPRNGVSGESIERSIRLAAVALAVLIGSQDFGEVRLADERMLRALQERVLLWARGPRDGRDGERLLQDILASAELLRSINLRQELIVHDERVVARALHELPAAHDEAALRAWFGRLTALFGRDEELDELLRGAARGEGDVGATLLRTRQALERLSAPRPAADETGMSF